MPGSAMDQYHCDAKDVIDDAEIGQTLQVEAEDEGDFVVELEVAESTAKCALRLRPICMMHRGGSARMARGITMIFLQDRVFPLILLLLLYLTS